MNESQFWNSHVGPNMGKLGHFSRVENAVEYGCPDVNYAIKGQQGWLELKVVRKGQVYFRRSQIPWLKARLRHCGNRGLWVLGAEEDGSKFYLWFAETVVNAPRFPHKQGVYVKVKDLLARATWSGAINWTDLAVALVFNAGLKNDFPSPLVRGTYEEDDRRAS